jgi:Na+-transporting NADH:ubiquinone oxidoreductase subunit A
MALHRNRRGLDLPLAGAPALEVGRANASPQVALLAADFPGIKPGLAVQVGDHVLRGQKLLEDKRIPGVAFTATAAGRVAAIHRGERRALISVVIDVDADDRPGLQVDFAAYRGVGAASLDVGGARALLQESGLWTALRPFNHVPAADATAEAIFVTATDSQPHAPPPARVIAPRLEDFHDGLVCLTKLGAGPVYLCIGADDAISAPPGVRVERFRGPHPSGSVSWHIHRVHPVSLERHVWHVGYQDVIAIGHLVRTGQLAVERVISLAGPSVRQPRLLRTRLGASIAALTRGELAPGQHRVLSGSVLAGRRIDDPASAFLGRYHLQVSALPEAAPARPLLPWLRPGGQWFSATRAFASALWPQRRFAMDTATWGAPRPMVPAVDYHRVMPFDIEPVLLLRALLARDDEQLERLGAVELEEEDLALATVICPSKTDYGALLRGALERMQKAA